MKLIDEKLVEAAAKAYALIKNNEHEITFMLSKSDFKNGVYFAEQQLKQKMIDFADWTSTNFTSLDGIHCKIGENNWITSEQLLEEFINEQK